MRYSCHLPSYVAMEDFGKYTGEQADATTQARASTILTQFQPIEVAKYMRRHQLTPDQRFAGVTITSKVMIYRRDRAGKLREEKWNMYSFAVTPAICVVHMEFICRRTFETITEVFQASRYRSWKEIMPIMRIKLSGQDVFEPTSEQCWALWIEDEATKVDEARKAGREPEKELEVIITVLFNDYVSQEDVRQIADKTMNGGEDVNQIADKTMDGGEDVKQIVDIATDSGEDDDIDMN